MVYRPPLTSPAFEKPINPPSVSATIDASPTWWQDNSQSSDAAAGLVIDSFGSQIRQFIGAQRQAYDLAGLDVHKRVASFDGLDVSYMNQQGRETIHYVVRPESTVTQSEENHSLTAEILMGLDGLAVVFFDGAT